MKLWDLVPSQCIMIYNEMVGEFDWPPAKNPMPKKEQEEVPQGLIATKSGQPGAG